jgi:hypothetical protein
MSSGDPPPGLHWVGDLLLDATLDVEANQGELALELVKGGRHFGCRFDVSTGRAQMTIDGLPDFAPTAPTAVKGIGRHRVCLANVDRQLLLWVDEQLVPFSAATTYDDLGNELPTADDLAPAGVAARGAAVTVEHLRLARDIYYIALDSPATAYQSLSDYDFPASPWPAARFADFFASPERWAQGDLFAWRRSVEFPLADDQFLMLGDNSAASKDGRLWADDEYPHHYAPRDALIGEVRYIVWPMRGAVR